MEKDSFLIKDLDKFVYAARALIFNNFGKGEEISTDIDKMLETITPDEQEEFDRVLSQDESLLIIKSLLKKKILKSKKEYYVLSDSLFIKILDSLNDRMVSNMLNNLVNKGLVETAFDTETNDFVFWVKDDENDQEAPETD